MEETLKTTEKKPTKSSQNTYVNIDERIQQMKLLFSNAKLPNILEELSKIGYTDEKLNSYSQKVSDIEALHQAQKKEYAKQYAETEKLSQKRKEINELYIRHFSFCKILFKNDVEVGKLLEFSGERKQAYASWYQQVSNFYAQLLANKELLDKVATINIKENDLKSQQNALLEISNIKENQAKETSKAQKATQERDKAINDLYPIYSELVAYAKIIFAQDQILEQLGISVKR